MPTTMTRVPGDNSLDHFMLLSTLDASTSTPNPEVTTPPEDPRGYVQTPAMAHGWFTEVRPVFFKNHCWFWGACACPLLHYCEPMWLAVSFHPGFVWAGCTATWETKTVSTSFNVEMFKRSGGMERLFEVGQLQHVRFCNMEIGPFGASAIRAPVFFVAIPQKALWYLLGIKKLDLKCHFSKVAVATQLKNNNSPVGLWLLSCWTVGNPSSKLS